MRKLLRFLIWTAIFVGALIGALRYFAIRWWRIPDDDPFLEASISPTLRGGDWIVLWRLSKPNFGDLVLCPEPGAPERVVIGRIAGEVEDQIDIDSNSLRVNHLTTSTERACGKFTVQNPNNGREITQSCDVEVLAGRTHLRGSSVGQKLAPKPIKTTVKDGKVFLLSDNRLFPYDSRDFGLVDRDTCKETVIFRLLGKEGFADQQSRFTFIQ